MNGKKLLRSVSPEVRMRSVPLQAGLRSSESGQVLPFVAVLLIVLLGMLALVLDGGNLYLHRRSMQNAADAGALAGARVLCYDGTYDQARAAAQQYAVQRNGADTAAIGVDGWTVEVVASRNVAMTFARLLGINEVPVAAEAAAKCAVAAAAKGVNPLSIPECKCYPDPNCAECFVVSEPGGPEYIYRIWDREKDSVTDQNNNPVAGTSSGSARGWLSLDCQDPGVSCNEGADPLKYYLDIGYPGWVYVESQIHKSSGIMQALFNHIKPGDELVIPVYKQIVECQSNDKCYFISRFAKFVVTAENKQEKYIEGHFAALVTPAPAGPEIPDAGVRTIVLIR